MQFLKDNKTYIAFIILAVLAYGAYSLYTSSGSSTSAPALTSSETSPLSPDLLATLTNLHTITLDPSIFTDPIFVSLSDFGVQIPAENVGRRNPFAPQ